MSHSEPFAALLVGIILALALAACASAVPPAATPAQPVAASLPSTPLPARPTATAAPSASTLIGQMIVLAGGSNIFDDVKEQYPTVSSEAVVSRAPQVILGPSSHGDGLALAKLLERPGWASLGAVKAGRVAIVNGDIVERGGPRLADALEAVARAIYPDRFQ